MPELPRDPMALAGLVAPEILVGLLLGFSARLALAAVHVGGCSLIALQSGLSAAAMFDPNEAAQGTVPGSFLAAAALTLLFAADFHHLLLRAIAAS
jgi:flagellar biosynthetic protein FliR